jgi:uncharacterized membrane protein
MGPHQHGEHEHLVEPHDELTSARTERVLWTTVGVCALVTLIGLVVLWPRGDVKTSLDASSLFGDRVDAVVVATEVAPCSTDPLSDCHEVTLQITSGPRRGTETNWEVPVEGGVRSYHVDDELYVYESRLADGTYTYEFADFRRDVPILILALIFVIAVLALARWKGVGALAGLAMSLAVLIVFMLPSLLRGNNAVAVALVGSSLIAFVALYLAHGVNIATTVALLSTFASLALIGLLSWIFVTASHFTGFTEDSSYVLTALGVEIDARGLLLAGIVIGSLGVLDDVTVTQVSAVWELRAAQPDAHRIVIYRSAINIGRDHIASTVNTLVLTYAGAALPLLLLFSISGQSVSAVATGEVVAIEIVRALVGSIGLIASVPIATWMAANVLAARQDH